MKNRKMTTVLVAIAGLMAMAVISQATDVIVQLDELNTVPATNRTVEVRKLQPFMGNPDFYYTTNGLPWFGITNAPVGDYTVNVRQRGSASAITFNFTVTATDLGVIGAHTNLAVLGAQTYPTTGKAAWSIVASDARYARIGEAGSTPDAITNNNTTPVVLSNSLTVAGSAVAPTNYTRHIANTNTSTLEITAGGVSLTLGSGAVRISDNHQFIGRLTGNGEGVTNIPLAGVTGLTPALTWLTNNAGSMSTAEFQSRALTNLVAGSNIVGALAAVSGANLTALNASALGSGTIPDARFPATLPAASGANLTGLNASALSSGTLAAARLPTTIPSTNFTGNAPFLTNVSGSITHSVLAYGANNGGSVDAWVGVDAAAAAVRAGGGTLYFPDGAYRLTNNVLLTGRTVSGSPWNNSDGNVRLKGSRLSRLLFYGGTNCIEALNAMRLFTLSDVHIIGTNSSRSVVNFHDGILMHGPTGASVIEDVSVAWLRTGIYLHDMTGLALRNVICYSNFVGVATGWQPADVTINGRFEKNYYGVFVGITNGVQQTGYANKFYSPPTTGAPTIRGGTFGYNEVGVLLARGMLSVMNAEFENNVVGFQLGFNSANAYEATFNNSLGANPTLRISHLNTVGANDIHVYRTSTILIDTMLFSGSIQLKNAGADASVIDSDTAVTVTKSGGASLTVNRDWRYVNGSLVPRSGMSWTNLVNVPAGFADGTDDGGSGGDSFWNTNTLNGGIEYTNRVSIRHWAAAYWTMDEAEGLRRDSAGTSDLTPIGVIGSGAGRVGNSATNVYFLTNYLMTADAPALRYQGPFTLGGWFKTYSGGVSDEAQLLHKTNEYKLYHTGGTANRIRFQFGNANLLLAESWTSTSPAGNTTNKLITITWDGSTLSGQIMAGTVYTTNLSTSGGAITPPTAGSGSLVVGKAATYNGADATFQGDEVFIVHRVISAGERSQIYNSAAGLAQTFHPAYTLNINARDITAARYIVPTNSAPSSVTVGTTPPDRWFQFFDSAGNQWFTPAWTNH